MIAAWIQIVAIKRMGFFGFLLGRLKIATASQMVSNISHKLNIDVVYHKIVTYGKVWVSIRIVFGIIVFALVEPFASASMFGEETAVLIEMAGNQLQELSQLAENIGIAKSQMGL